MTRTSPNRLPAAIAAARPAAEAGVNPGGLLSLIRRIHEAVETETTAIRTDLNFDVAASNARKSRYLYDLNKAARGVPEGALGAEHREALTSLRRALSVNEQALLAHLNAVREVADLIQRAIHGAETDGTYSAHEFGRP